MSNDKQNQDNQAASAPVANTPPSANTPPQAPITSIPSEDPFALDPRLIGEMQKGDTVMLVTTEGTSTGAVTAIKLLDGVEPLLAVAPKNGGESMTLSPWSLGGNQGGEDAN